jgi:hypothetical protein
MPAMKRFWDLVLSASERFELWLLGSELTVAVASERSAEAARIERCLAFDHYMRANQRACAD